MALTFNQFLADGMLQSSAVRLAVERKRNPGERGQDPETVMRLQPMHPPFHLKKRKEVCYNEPTLP